MHETVLKRFEDPDEIRVFEKGKFELVRIGGMTIGRATYEPGWKWSVHVGPSMGASRCNVEHVGLVLSAVPPLRWRTAPSTNSAPARSSTFQPGLPVTIVGWWAMNRTSRFTFLGLTATRANRLPAAVDFLSGSGVSRPVLRSMIDAHNLQILILNAINHNVRQAREPSSRVPSIRPLRP